MTETPGYEDDERTRRGVAIAAGLLAVMLAIGGGAYALWVVDVRPAVLTAPPKAEGVAANETVDLSVSDAPDDFGTATGERVLVIHHQGGTRVFYRNLRVVLYDDGKPVLSLTSPEWKTGSLALSENGTVPSNASTFAPSDRLVVAEQPYENAAILDGGDVYVIALVDAESGRTIGRETLTLQ